MCVCARVLTPLHEDEIWMIQMKAFLSPVPLNVGRSAESRGLVSTLGAVPIHSCRSESSLESFLSQLIALIKMTILERCERSAVQ